ncbi:T9SS type A sorting domain-containing protein [candidate division KSB1 bacterium]|nr:T9SS type A sorting domain-containing protein [candidate division KSB1 bacterium]
MRSNSKMLVLIMVMLFGLSLPEFILAQARPGKKIWPDSLKTVTLSGVVLIDSSRQNLILLDENEDGAADYVLAFGPAWYQPESGAVRPTANDRVTIEGLLRMRSQLPVVIVFKINDLLWREPIENWWQHRDWCDRLQVKRDTGVVFIDTTYFYAHYYLDTDGDSLPDYRLDFGPHWYEPKSGAVRPISGDTIVVVGVIKPGPKVTRLVVLKINDLVWRELQGPAPWSGGWIKKDKNHPQRIHCYLDSTTWIEIPPGALHGGNPHDPQFPDSLFCGLNPVWFDSLPGHPDSARFGWHFYFDNPAGQPIHGKGYAVRFLKRLRFHLGDGGQDSTGSYLGKVNLAAWQLKYWDAENQLWLPVEDSQFNRFDNSFEFETDVISDYYALFGPEGSSAVPSTDIKSIPTVFELAQNYPNPFNPTTSIQFSLNVTAPVRLSIFNLTGQEVRTLINEIRPQGAYTAIWDGRDDQGHSLSSGTYWYQIRVNHQTQIRALVFLK